MRVGVVGTGMMGCEHLRNLLAIEGVEITAISDPHVEPLDWARKTLEGSLHRPREFSDHRELAESGLVDAVIVASPNFTHKSVLDDLLRTDLHVLVEKPLCTTVEDCEQVVALAAKRNAVTWVGLEYRYMPSIEKMHALVTEGRIGEVRMMAIREHRFPFLQKVDNWNRFNRFTGGTLVEKCCHFFDLMNLVVAAEPTRVFASGSQDVNHLDERYGGEQPDIIDNAYVIIDYENGARAMLDLCMFAEMGSNEQEITVVGDRGKIEAYVPGEGVVILGDRVASQVERISCLPTEAPGHVGFHHGASFIEVRNFLEAARGERTVDVDVTQGMWSVAVGVAAHRSIDLGRPVFLNEVRSH
jgi:myo-inositol 2-dehydrogenase/D-chiro-inositol 1-dehydrogenase